MNQIVLDHLMSRYPEIKSNGMYLGNREYLKRHLDQVRQAVTFLHHYTRARSKQTTLCRDLVSAAELRFSTTICQGAMLIAALSLYIPISKDGQRISVRILEEKEIY